MNFKQHINIESVTIEDFINSQNEINVTELKNDSFSTYDFEFTSGSTNNQFPQKGITEVKTRKYSSTKFEGGILLEIKKLANIMDVVTFKRKKNINDNWRGYYLVKYTDVTFLFELDSVQLGNIKMILCPESSSKDGSKEWVYKACFLLNPDDAIIRIENT
ncbi:MAG: hypothetical protein Q8O62_04480 [Aequorivita sp.]|nr:hypothetical protein [Aequorivita sp.]